MSSLNPPAAWLFAFPPKALAQELLDAAFRDNCDPLRERYSRQIMQRTQREWGKQVRRGISAALALMIETAQLRQQWVPALNLPAASM